MSITIFLPKQRKYLCVHPTPLSWLTNVLLNAGDGKNNGIQNTVLFLNLNKSKGTECKPE